MTKLLILIALLSTLSTYAQTGKYIGLQYSGMTYQPSKKGRNEIKGKEIYTEKNLTLNRDSTFSFQYINSNTLFQQVPLYECVGKWRKVNDTIFLDSKYKEQDFVSVIENHRQLTPSDLVIMTFKSTIGFFQADVELNDDRVGTTNYCDTFYYKCNSVKSIRLNFSFPGSMKSEYKPLDKYSNCFSFKINPEVDDNNLFFSNYKLIIINNEIKPLTKWGPLSVEKNYKKVSD